MSSEPSPEQWAEAVSMVGGRVDHLMRVADLMDLTAEQMGMTAAFLLGAAIHRLDKHGLSFTAAEWMEAVSEAVRAAQ